MKNEKEAKFQGVSYPDPSSVDTDFSKYYQNIEYDHQVVDNMANALNEFAVGSEAKYLNLIKNIASVIISDREGSFAIEPFCMMRDGRSFAPCDLDSDDIKFLSKIYTKIQPIKLRAKVADVLWEASKINTYAQQAEKSYIELVRENETWYEQREYWGRLLYINKKIKGICFAEIQKIAEEKILGDCLDIFGVLWLYINVFKNSNIGQNVFEYVVSKLKEHFSKKGLFNNKDYLKAINLVKQKSTEIADDLLETIVNSFVASAEECSAQESLRAGIQFDCAIQYLQLIHDKKKYDVENRKVIYAQKRQNARKAGLKYFQLCSEYVDISSTKEQIADFFDSIDDKWKALSILSSLVIFSEQDLEKLNDQVEQLIHQSLFLVLGAGSTFLDSNGRVIASNSGYDPKKPLRQQEIFTQRRANYFRDFQMNLDTEAKLFPALYKIHTKFAYSEEELIAMIQECTLIPVELQYAFVRGFHLFFEGDVFAAIHILAPSFEAYVREIFKRNEWKNTCIKGPSEDDYLSLSSLIKDSKLFDEKYGESVRFQIHTIFCDPCGSNLRNDIAHGLFRWSDRSQQYSVYAIVFILYFLLLDKSIHNEKT